MNKSKSFFIIMGATYLLISLLAFTDIIKVTMNYLLGLSITSILISMSDICSSFISYVLANNNTNFMMKLTFEYLEEKRLNDIANAMPIYSPVNTDAIMKNLQISHPKMNKAKKNNDLRGASYLKGLHFFHNAFFILAIAIFLVVPFIDLELIQYEKISILITISAFAAICFSIYLGEKITEVNNKHFEFMNGTGLAIECRYNGYYAYINAHQ